jgi:hypothetical protein
MEQDGRSKRKSSEAAERLVEKKQKQRAQQEQISSGAKSRDETAGHSVLPTVSRNQQSSEGIDQRKDHRDQRRRAPAHAYDSLDV